MPDLHEIVRLTYGALLDFFHAIWDEFGDIDLDSEMDELWTLGWQHGLIVHGMPHEVIAPVLVAVDMATSTIVRSDYGANVAGGDRYLARLAEAQRPWIKRYRKRRASRVGP